MPNRLRYDGDVISNTITSGSSASYAGLDFATVQPDFYLSTANFLRLKDDRNIMSTGAKGLAPAFFGYFITLMPKALSDMTGGAEHVSQNEWSIIVCGAVLCLAMAIIGRVFPSERKKIMKIIETHFETAPVGRQPVAGASNDQ